MINKVNNNQLEWPRFAKATCFLLAVFGVLAILKGCNLNEDTKGFGYSKIGNVIYFEGKRIDRSGRGNIDQLERLLDRELVLCSGVDADTFSALSEEYSKDRNNVYYKWISPGNFWVVRIPDADASSFSVVDFNIAKDANHVWYADEKILGADPESLALVGPKFVWKDKDRVFYQAIPIPNADPKTFIHLGQGYYSDEDRVYWCTTILKGALSKDFKTFGELPFGSDGQKVWKASDSLIEIDGGSFEPFAPNLYKDKNGVYLGKYGIKVPAIDPLTFQQLTGFGSNNLALLLKDKNDFWVYEPTYGDLCRIRPSKNTLHLKMPILKTIGGKREIVGYVAGHLTNFDLIDVTVTKLAEHSDLDIEKVGVNQLQSNEELLAQAWKKINKTMGDR